MVTLAGGSRQNIQPVLVGKHNEEFSWQSSIPAAGFSELTRFSQNIQPVSILQAQSFKTLVATKLGKSYCLILWQCSQHCILLVWHLIKHQVPCTKDHRKRVHFCHSTQTATHLQEHFEADHKLQQDHLCNGRRYNDRNYGPASPLVQFQVTQGNASW